MKGYLDRGSIAFYEIYNEKEGALMINVNTQNQNCAVLRVKRGENRSHNSGQYDFITSDSSLLIPDAEKMHYDISVEATSHCFYSIDYTHVAAKKYSTIERGIYADVHLNKDQEKSLIFHGDKSKFRVLALHQSG